MTRLCAAFKTDRLTGELRQCRLRVAPHSTVFCTHHEKDAVRRELARDARSAKPGRFYFAQRT